VARARRPGLAGPVLRLAAAAALGFAARGRIAVADARAREAIAHRRSDTFDKAMPVLTDLGSTYAIAGASAVLWLSGRRRLARDLTAAGGIAWTLAQAAKPLFRRARPYDTGTVDVLVRKPAGLSYPSGHPAVAAAMTRVVEDRVTAPARGFLGKIPRMVAFSRVYVGVHYPSDVIGGMLLGRAVGDLWLRYASNGASGRGRPRPSDR